jgi:hypothetical protein
VVAFDHTGLQIFPTSKLTRAPVGASHVPMHGLEDKRQITGVALEVMDGNTVGVQLIYQGLTDACLPTQRNEPRQGLTPV